MQTDLVIAYKKIDSSYKSFKHKGAKLTKAQVRKVLKWAIEEQNYTTTAQLTDNDVDTVLGLS